MKIYFACPSCDYPGHAETPSSSPWRCPQCDHLLSLAQCSHHAPRDEMHHAERDDYTKDETVPSSCRVCGNGELYKKKDFPHTLGLAILTLACVASTITYGLYDKWLTWAILIGSAALDGLLYLWVKDVVVCYRCQAHHRGIAIGSPVPPFDLAIGERYRQEQIRLSYRKDKVTR